jgi:hypothetical protein
MSEYRIVSKPFIVAAHRQIGLTHSNGKRRKFGSGARRISNRLLNYVSEFERCPKINIGVVEAPPAGAFEGVESESLTLAPSTLSPSQV